MLCSHCPINDSSGYLHNTVYPAVNQVMMDCKNFITSTLFDTGHRVSQRGSTLAEIFPFSSQFFESNRFIVLHAMGLFSLTAIHSPHKYLLGTLWYPRKKVMVEVNQPQTCLHLTIWKQLLRNIFSSFTYT